MLTGTSYGVADKRTGGLGEEFAAVFLNYTTSTALLDEAIPLTPPSFSQVPGQDGTSPATLRSGERYPLMTSGQNGFTLLKADISRSQGISYLPGTSDLFYNYRPGRSSELFFRQADGQNLDQDRANYTGLTKRRLYNVLATRTRQYGSVEQAIYYPIASSTKEAAPLEIFTGDTFISKIALVSATQENTDREPGIGYITLSYFHVESTVNANYRHFVAATTGQGTLPYYPKSRNLWQQDGSGVMQYPTSLGHATGYNKQYSFTSNLTPFTTKDYTVEQVSKFENRILYSAQAVEGEQLDAYRSFKANDYHDVPKSFGPITSLAEVAGRLYTHTTGCLWRESFNERSTFASSEGEVNLGNGGLFPVPSQAVLAIDGGYAGSQFPLAAITTPAGHFFVDQPRGKVFLLADGLQELVKDNLYKDLTPAVKKATRFRASYDYLEERYVLCADNFATISWSARNKKWVSYHSYSPSFTFSTAVRTLHQKGNTLSTAYVSNPLVASVSVVSNVQPDASKVFTNATLQVTQVPDTIACITLSQASVVTRLVPYVDYGQEAQAGERLYTLVNDEVALKLPRDEEEGKLRGKWMQATWTFLSQQTPAILKQLTTILAGRARS